MNRFTHFEFATTDREKTAAFYRAVFGWHIQKWAGPVDYWLVNTGYASTPGINGGLMQAGGDFSGTINTVEVEDLDAVIAKVKAHGSTIIFEKQPVPGVGQLAYFKDNSGIVVGIMQPDPNSSM
jgi:hypothetical protein